MNGRTATLGDRVVPLEDRIEVDGIEVASPGPLVYLAFNKPAGVISTSHDPHGRPALTEQIPEACKADARIFPVGRLDKDSTGLILLTNDGFLANRLMHPSFGVPREYFVEVNPVPANSDLARLRKGLRLDDGDTGPAKVSVRGRKGDVAQVNMVIHAGRKRQIRRSFEHLGYRVLSLNRVRIGRLGLGTLEQGACRNLRPDEVAGLYRETGLDV